MILDTFNIAGKTGLFRFCPVHDIHCKNEEPNNFSINKFYRKAHYILVSFSKLRYRRGIVKATSDNPCYLAQNLSQ